MASAVHGGAGGHSSVCVGLHERLGFTFLAPCAFKCGTQCPACVGHWLRTTFMLFTPSQGQTGRCCRAAGRDQGHRANGTCTGGKTRLYLDVDQVLLSLGSWTRWHYAHYQEDVQKGKIWHLQSQSAPKASGADCYLEEPQPQGQVMSQRPLVPQPVMDLQALLRPSSGPWRCKTDKSPNVTVLGVWQGGRARYSARNGV